MKRAMVTAAVVLGLVACSSEAAEPSACADIGGNYKVTSTRVSGTCDPSIDGDGDTSLIFSKGEGGGWDVLLPGATGACPGELDTKTCKYLANCTGKSADGAVTATFSVEYVFSRGSFSGSTAGGLRPPAVAKACDFTYRETGAKL